MQEMTITLTRNAMRIVLRGLLKEQKAMERKIKAAKKRGFKEHEAATLAMEACDIDDVMNTMWNTYKINYPSLK